MTTVRITDSLRHDLTVRLRNQFRPACQKAVNEAEEATLGLLKQNKAALSAMLVAPWGEHAHLRDLVPTSWCKKPSSQVGINVLVPDPDEEAVRKAIANLSDVDEPSTINMAGFSWTPNSDQEANALAEPAAPINVAEMEHDTALNPVRLATLADMVHTLGITENDCVLPPDTPNSYYCYHIRACDLCPDQNSLLAYLATLYEVGDLRAKAHTAESGLMKVLNNVPSVNRLLKEYPQFEPVIPDHILRKVREKVTRGPRKPAEQDNYEAINSDEIAALQTAATLSGLN
jgi:hypothetical protein